MVFTAAQKTKQNKTKKKQQQQKKKNYSAKWEKKHFYVINVIQSNVIKCKSWAQ